MTKGKTRHGGPYDRGTCDSYYRRGHTPHYFTGETGFSDRIEMKNMSKLTANLKKIYKDNTSITKTKLNTILTKDLLMDSKECLRLGLVNEII